MSIPASKFVEIDPESTSAEILLTLLCPGRGGSPGHGRHPDPDIAGPDRPANTGPIRLDNPPPRAALLCLTPERLRGDEATRVDLDAERVTLGRAPANSVSLIADGVSRVHAALVPEPGRWAIRDLDSKNGLAVNTDIVEHSHLTHRDIVSVGKLRYRFVVLDHEGR